MPKKNTQFMVLTTQRSGSTWLMEVLARQPGVHAIEEIFLSREDTPTTTIGFRRERWMHYRKACPVRLVRYFRLIYVWRYLRQVVFGQESVGHVTGFKLMYNQLRDKPEIFFYALCHQLKVVHLVRRNTFDVLLSDKIRLQLNRSHAFEGVEIPVIALDIPKLIEDIEKTNRRVAFFAKLLCLCRIPHMTVYYEDLRVSPEVFEDIVHFIGSSYADNAESSRFKKMNNQSYPECIRNYEAVESALKQHGYAHYLT